MWSRRFGSVNVLSGYSSKNLNLLSVTHGCWAWILIYCRTREQQIHAQPETEENCPCTDLHVANTVQTVQSTNEAPVLVRHRGWRHLWLAWGDVGVLVGLLHRIDVPHAALVATARFAEGPRVSQQLRELDWHSSPG